MPVVPSTSTPVMARLAQRATRLGEPLFGFNMMQPLEQKQRMMNTFMAFMEEQARKREERRLNEVVFDWPSYLASPAQGAITRREQEQAGPGQRFSQGLNRAIKPALDVVSAVRGGGGPRGTGQSGQMVQLPSGSGGTTSSPINPSFYYGGGFR